MGDHQASGNAQSNPHWIGDSSKVRGPNNDGSFIIPSRALNITWGNDPRYWEWVKLCETESRVREFEEGVMLQQVNWLEVTGRFELVISNTAKRSYKVYYVMKFNEDAFGWSHAVIKFKVKLVEEGDDNSKELGEENIWREVNLQQYGETPGTWHKICVGEFNVVGNNNIAKVEVGMFEVETDWWKGSMILGGIWIEPV
ncbi:hypothetical protein C2S53_010201 [Perilla frutescens var. hirtella]|uniref:Uncharacterized protein n=1 Tax=Perilla frutescens var. hirtella TaxID=608512 RepID=A0AAD4NXG4_PERFH|nr:hypothetical protein C2S53_010201 [Perilla frutescens var. hirtella]